MASTLLDLEKILAQMRRRLRLLELARGDSGDAEPPVTISDTEPDNPQVGDLWYQP